MQWFFSHLPVICLFWGSHVTQIGTSLLPNVPLLTQLTHSHPVYDAICSSYPQNNYIYPQNNCNYWCSYCINFFYYPGTTFPEDKQINYFYFCFSCSGAINRYLIWFRNHNLNLSGKFYIVFEKFKRKLLPPIWSKNGRLLNWSLIFEHSLAVYFIKYSMHVSHENDLIEWKIDWLNEILIEWKIYWKKNWLIERLNDWKIDW